MIKNVRMKLAIQNTLFSVFSIINKFVHHNKCKILLYSNSGLRDNIGALYDYLITEKYNEKYEIICSTNDYRKYINNSIPNVKYVSNIKGVLYFFTSAYVFYCFGKIPIVPGRNQKVVQMWHGAPYKAPDEGMLKGHSWKRQYYTNVLSTSKHFVSFWSYAFSIPANNIIIGGYPRCDALFMENPQYQFGDYQKIILWAPTFRKSQITGYSDVKCSGGLVPILRPDEYRIINKKLKEIGVKIVVKLHPMQDLDGYNLTDFDHFILMSHAEFIKRKMDLYLFMVQCDALITDYSSIFFDFLLLDRPIGFTEDDMEDYGSTRGFAVKDPDSYKPGFRIKTKDDLIKFATDLVNDIDLYKADRSRVMDLSNDYRDGGFSKRLLNSVGIK